jgi:N-methylhydantoinase B
MLERRVIPPWGVRGGGDGAAFRVRLNPGAGEQIVGGKQTLVVKRGDVLLIETCGGGGYGDAAARPADAVQRDRDEGYV